MVAKGKPLKKPDPTTLLSLLAAKFTESLESGSHKKVLVIAASEPQSHQLKMILRMGDCNRLVTKVQSVPFLYRAGACSRRNIYLSGCFHSPSCIASSVESRYTNNKPRSTKMRGGAS